MRTRENPRVIVCRAGNFMVEQERSLDREPRSWDWREVAALVGLVFVYVAARAWGAISGKPVHWH